MKSKPECIRKINWDGAAEPVRILQPNPENFDALCPRDCPYYHTCRTVSDTCHTVSDIVSENRQRDVRFSSVAITSDENDTQISIMVTDMVEWKTTGQIIDNGVYIRAVSAKEAEAKLAEKDKEIEALKTWEGLMALLDEHWPEDIFPTTPDDPARDAGPRIVSLLRRNRDLEKKIKELEKELAEMDGWGDEYNRMITHYVWKVLEPINEGGDTPLLVPKHNGAMCFLHKFVDNYVEMGAKIKELEKEIDILIEHLAPQSEPDDIRQLIKDIRKNPDKGVGLDE